MRRSRSLPSHVLPRKEPSSSVPTNYVYESCNSRKSPTAGRRNYAPSKGTQEAQARYPPIIDHLCVGLYANSALCPTHEGFWPQDLARCLFSFGGDCYSSTTGGS